MESIKWIEAEQLAKKLNDSDFAIIDVRTYDYLDGKIPNSIHIPYDEFHDAIDRISDLKAKNIVMHCHFSQTRAPSAALLLSEQNKNNKNIMILKGGWKNWHKLFKGTDLIEGIKSQNQN